MTDKDSLCPLCGLPKELCVCDKLGADEQQIVIFNGRRKWGKVVTILDFQGDFKINFDEMLTEAKKKAAAGGTLRKGNKIEVMGDHRFTMKKFLVEQGFPAENIIIEE
ncbi:MAG: stress response translation initiation inhibitor YciH [Candidatus Lokiarchaeota archaeon]|nr:stress response translation initiation inhibitor YciH [Candidatus Lokiarchaeota archaeon]